MHGAPVSKAQSLKAVESEAWYHAVEGLGFRVQHVHIPNPQTKDPLTPERPPT